MICFVSDHEQAINRFMKLPKKKLTDQAKQEANEDLYVYRKKCHKVGAFVFVINIVDILSNGIL